jgi:hypothetical protein
VIVLFKILIKSLLYFELLPVIFGILYFKKFKDTYWKYFIYYLGFIFIAGALHNWIIQKYFNYLGDDFGNYFLSYFVIPIEFLFFYWLYAYKSLNQKKLYWIFSILYLLSFAFHALIKETISSIYSFNYVVGAFFLGILVFLEYMKQIKSDDIIKFKDNMMFYVNLGVCMLYIGTLPFFSFFGILLKNMDIYINYYTIFLIVNHLMYLLFTAAIIWGKPNTY